MDWGAFARGEWVLFELVLLAIAGRELVSGRRESSRHRERDARLEGRKDRDASP